MIGACWIGVGVALAWQAWDTHQLMVEMKYENIPSWKQTRQWFALCALAALALAAVESLSNARWAGVVLMLAALALGAASLFLAIALATCPHGCSNARPGAILGALIAFFFFIPVSVASLIVGWKQTTGKPGG